MSRRIHHRSKLIAITVAITLSIGLFGGRPTPGDDPSAQRRTKPLAEALRDTTSFKVDQTPWTEAVEKLAERHGIPIVIDKRSIVEAGIDPAQQISHSLSGITVRNALALILNPLGLDWTIKHDVLLVTTAEKVASMMEVRIYPVRGLIARGFASGKHDLLHAIRTTIRRGSWSGDGGAGTGTISWIPEALVVRQNRDVHQQIDDLLTDLKQGFDGGPPRPSQPAEIRTQLELKNATTLEFEAPLPDVLQYISQLHQVSIVIDLAAFQGAKKDPNELIKGTFRGISLQSALDLILEPLDLDYVSQDEVIKVMPREKAANMLLTRPYFVQKHTSESFKSNQLAGVITVSIAPETWDVVKGDGSIAALPECLVVTQSPRVHREIDAFLDNLLLQRRVEKTEKTPPPGSPPLPSKE